MLGSKRRLDLAAHINVPDTALYRCRIVYDDTTLEIEYIPYQKRAVRTLQAVEADQLSYALKYADRSALEDLFVQRGSSDDILIVQNGLITDTSIANIAFFDSQRWLTPRKPLLEGTTRARLLDTNKISLADISLEDLPKFTHFALMNAMIGFEEIKNGIIAPIKGSNDVI